VDHPKKILIFRIGQLGDSLVSLPALWAIRKHFLNAQISFLGDTHDHSNFVKPFQIFPDNVLIDRYISYEAKETGVKAFKLFNVIRNLRRECFDTLIYLAPRRRMRRQILRDLSFFRMAGIKNFKGQKGISIPSSKSREPLPHLEKEADHLLHRLSLSGIPVPPAGQGCMDLRLTPQEIEYSRNWLHRRQGLNPEKLLIGFGVGSKYPAKVWPEQRFEELGRHLIQHFNSYPIVFGGPEDREIGRRLLDHWGVGANASGELNVRQAAAALSLCRLYIGNDTGTMHLAAAVGVRCVAIFSARDFPGCWYPYGRGHLVLRRQVPCEGCMLQTCKEKETACLYQISVEEVTKTVCEALN